jgi:hypothetical protein
MCTTSFGQFRSYFVGHMSLGRSSERMADELKSTFKNFMAGFESLNDNYCASTTSLHYTQSTAGLSLNTENSNANSVQTNRI